MTWFCMINHCHFQQSSIYIPAKKNINVPCSPRWQKTVNLVFGGLWFWWYWWFKYRRAAAGFHKCHRSQTPEKTRISVTWSVKKGPSMLVPKAKSTLQAPYRFVGVQSLSWMMDVSVCVCVCRYVCVCRNRVRCVFKELFKITNTY